MEGAWSLTVDDKYWQIMAKAVEWLPQLLVVAQEANHHNYLIFLLTYPFMA